MHRFCSKC